MEKLKPCPFCGGRAKRYQEKNGIVVENMTLEPNTVHFVLCTECSALVSESSEKEAAEAWNKRAAHEEPDIPIYDKETRHENCTVQILENTETGRISVGWWRNE